MKLPPLMDERRTDEASSLWVLFKGSGEGGINAFMLMEEIFAGEKKNSERMKHFIGSAPCLPWFSFNGFRENFIVYVKNVRSNLM